ncbi:MAG: DUF2304 domain-containing protein [Candidatus Krumholzibacteria bacterium]|nr:DUF2304 domain-containing protein [Candidatus Krumholzibacteria bacterium]MDH4336416.1 DUF2304 domain-containing protein [Candidatus Krumholzibacteria bacterium]MDH5269541.1 DUF2304 domain-containing protein [Candidatus Krumholzibacteria bacterium]
MRPVQFVLILLLLGVLMLYFSRLRSGLLDRVVVLLFGLLGIAMVVAPDWTNGVAHLVGVGRGVDLFFYLAIVGFAFAGLVLYSKVRDLELQITKLVRIVAIDRARQPDAIQVPEERDGP